MTRDFQNNVLTPLRFSVRMQQRTNTKSQVANPLPVPEEARSLEGKPPWRQSLPPLLEGLDSESPHFRTEMKGYLQCFVPWKTLPQAGSNKPHGDTMTLLWGPQATPCCLHNQLSTASAHLELSFGLRWFSAPYGFTWTRFGDQGSAGMCDIQTALSIRVL